MVNNPILCAATMTFWLVALLRFVIISIVSGIVDVMPLVVPAVAFFAYFGLCGSHYNSSVGSVKCRLQNVKSRYQYAYWKVPTT